MVLFDPVCPQIESASITFKVVEEIVLNFMDEVGPVEPGQKACLSFKPFRSPFNLGFAHGLNERERQHHNGPG